ncbi:MAG: hypothetical protein J6B62_08395 [Bacteroidales bacterium]|nr:hypothetical protein [Bacteroidales bacterium]
METPEKIEDIFHVYSDGMRTDSLFLDDKAFVAGMNAAAICSLKCKVKVLCFCLMDNHVHFILNGTRVECGNFIIRYKTWYAKWRGGLQEDMLIGIKAIETQDYLLSAIAYVLRNPIAAGFPYVAGDYKWSTASLYFREFHKYMGLPISEIGLMKRRELFSTRQEFPDDWTMDDSGMIWPGHYVQYETVNKLYRNVKRYMYYQSATQEASVSESLGMTEMIVLPDKELRKAAKGLSEEIFAKDNIVSLSVNERLILAKKLRQKFGCSIKQIARIVHLEFQQLQEFL